jgi:hypothetical protein
VKFEEAPKPIEKIEDDIDMDDIDMNDLELSDDEKVVIKKSKRVEKKKSPVKSK